MRKALHGSHSIPWCARRTACGASTGASWRGSVDVRCNALPLRTLSGLAAVALLFSMSTAWAQTTAYPAKLVRIVNPVAPGGNQDTIARAIAEQLTRAFGQQVIVESRPGASAIVGTRYVKST